MKQSVFDYITERWLILKANIWFSIQNDFAYSINVWSNFVSTTVFIVIYLFFIETIYGNVDRLAGYSKNEMLLFFLIAEFVFQTNTAILFPGLQHLVRNVNTGYLDFVLSKPIPHLFYITFREINLLAIIRNQFSFLVIMPILIDWSALSITWQSLVSGITIMFMGVAITHIFQFLFSLTAFWTGEGESMLDLTWTFEFHGGRTIPLEGFNPNIRYALLSLIPVLFSTAASTSVILGKSDGSQMLLITTIVFGIFLVLKKLTWQIALRNYTSASS